MQSKVLSLGVLLLLVQALGCGNSGNGDGGVGDMRTVAPDMLPACNPMLSVGDPCSNKNKKCTGCTGTHPVCLTDITLGMSNPISLDQNYCSNTSCDPTKSLDTCGDSGKCADLDGSGTFQCYEQCTKGKCRTNYSCFTTSNDPARTVTMTPTSVHVCLPSELGDCDPTRAMQCTTIGGAMTSTITNGDQYAGCIRNGVDNVGRCQLIPCSIGPGNCPPLGGGPASCFYLVAAQVQGSGASPTDALKGTFCFGIPPAAMQAAVGAACTHLNDCVDNASCVMGTCRQSCYQGTQPTFMGGMAKYKNPATACPAGTTCNDSSQIGTASFPGACIPK